MALKERVYWQDTTVMPGGDTLEDLPASSDVVVVGGGIPGLAAALQLARRAARVTLLEAQTPGWGASSRNGGMALTGLKLDAAVVEKRYGVELTRQLFDDSIASLVTVERIVQREEIACDFTRSGHLLVANKPAHYEALQNEAEWYAQHFNHITHTIPKNELHREIGSDVYYGGLVDETSAGVNPAQYVVGLAKAAERAGARVCSKAPLLRIERSGTGYKLYSERGETTAEKVLVTTGGYTSSATPTLQRRIIPIGSYIIATSPITNELRHELIPHDRMVFDYRHFLNYYRFSADNRMIFGGRAAFFPETTSSIRSSAEILRKEMIYVFPQLKNTPVEYAWGGTLDFAFDLMPHAGQLEGIYYALGFAGHGVALGTHLGTMMADAILDDKVAELPYNAYPFPEAPLGLYQGKAWFLPLIGLWHRILDWLY